MITGLARTRIGRVAAGNQILQPPDAPDEFCVSMATISSRIEAPRTRGSAASAIVPGSHQARWRFGPGLVMTMPGTAAHRDSRVRAKVSSAMSDVFIICAGGIDSWTQAAMSVST